MAVIRINFQTHKHRLGPDGKPTGDIEEGERLLIAYVILSQDRNNYIYAASIFVDEHAVSQAAAKAWSENDREFLRGKSGRAVTGYGTGSPVGLRAMLSSAINSLDLASGDPDRAAVELAMKLHVACSNLKVELDGQDTQQNAVEPGPSGEGYGGIQGMHQEQDLSNNNEPERPL